MLLMIFGTPSSRGVASGPACVMKTDDDYRSVRDGDVVIARVISAAVIPLLSGAAALVMESGGALSTASTIARELNLPAITGAARATSAIVDGDMVTVDGSVGLATVRAAVCVERSDTCVFAG